MISEMEVFRIDRYSDATTVRMAEVAMADLKKFFEIDWDENLPHIVIVSDRNTINALNRTNTPDWMIAWAEEDGNICLLDRNVFEQESSHKYSDEYYLALIKHELAHSFVHILVNNRWVPEWLNEGIAIYASGQTLLKSKPDKYSSFIEYFDSSDSGVYREAGFVVEFLAKEYGKDKLFKLLKEGSGEKNKKKFADVFNSIYGFELEYDNFIVL